MYGVVLSTVVEGLSVPLAGRSSEMKEDYVCMKIQNWTNIM